MKIGDQIKTLLDDYEEKVKTEGEWSGWGGPGSSDGCAAWREKHQAARLLVDTEIKKLIAVAEAAQKYRQAVLEYGQCGHETQRCEDRLKHALREAGEW